MAQRRTVSAAEAAAALGVSRATIYAYVSRGLIRSEPVPGSRSHRYHWADIQALLDRREGDGGAGEAALHRGAPVMTSEITHIDGGQLYYRGVSALALAATHSVEEVAGVLWAGDPAAGRAAFGLPWPESLHPGPELQRITQGPWRLAASLAIAGAADTTAHDLEEAAVARTGARIVRLMASVSCGRPVEQGLVAGMIEGWGLDDEAAGLLTMVLVLSADHELNVSSFTARCVASAGSNPYAVVGGALAALQGFRHGGHTARVEQFVKEAQASGVERAVLGRLERGEDVPGFGHPLYPDGDPRGTELLAGALALAGSDRGAGGSASEVSLVTELVAAVGDLIHRTPNLDIGLVAARAALGLRSGAAVELFAVGRATGWIGHAMEQYADGRLIRPRALYVGPAPEA